MKKLDRQLWCEYCDSGVTYTGTEPAEWADIRELFAEWHTHTEEASGRRVD